MNWTNASSVIRAVLIRKYLRVILSVKPYPQLVDESGLNFGLSRVVTLSGVEVKRRRVDGYEKIS